MAFSNVDSYPKGMGFVTNSRESLSRESARVHRPIMCEICRAIEPSGWVGRGPGPAWRQVTPGVPVAGKELASRRASARNVVSSSSLVAAGGVALGSKASRDRAGSHSDLQEIVRSRMSGVIAARARQTSVAYADMEKTYLDRVSLRRMVTAADVAAMAA
jgi:hypothetical protein